MDGATIFVAFLSAVFFGFIIFLAVKSRRNEDAEKPAETAEAEPRANEPRKAA